MTSPISPSVGAFVGKYFNDNFTAVLASAGTTVQSAYLAPATQAFADWKVANADKKFYLVAGDKGGVSQLLKVANLSDGTPGTKPQNAVEVNQNVAYGIESAQLSPTDWLMARIADEFRATSAAQSLGPALNQTPEPNLSFDTSSLDTASLRRLLKALGSKADDEQRNVAIGNLADRRDALARLGLSRENLSIALDLQARFAAESVALQKEAVEDNNDAEAAKTSTAITASVAEAAAAAARAAANDKPKNDSLRNVAEAAEAAASAARSAANVAAAKYGETSARLAEFPVFEKMVNDALANLVAQSSSDLAVARAAADLFNVTRSAAGALNSTLQGAADRQLAQFDQVIAQFGTVLDLQQGTGAYVLATAPAQAREALVQLIKAELIKMLREPGRLAATTPMTGQFNTDDALLGGATAPPALLAAGAMGNLTTNDLLQVIRTLRQKTANALILATMEMVKSQQATIRLKTADKIATLNDTITKLAEAEKKRKEMEAIKIGMMVLGGLMVFAAIVVAVVSLGTASAASAGMVAASASTMAAATAAAAAATTAAVTAVTVAAVSTIMFATMTALSESKDSNGVSQMDKLMAKLAKALAPEGSDDPEADGADRATALMIGIQVAIMLLVAVASMGTALPGAVASTMSSVANTVISAVKSAVDAAIRIAMQVIQEGVKAIAKALDAALQAMLTAVQAAIRAAMSAVTSAVTAVQEAIRAGASAATSAVTSVVDAVKTAGTQLSNLTTAGVTASVKQALVQALESVKAAVSTVTAAARTVSNLANFTQGALAIDQAESQKELAVFERDVSMLKAEVEKLKALIKYLSSLLDGDMEFAKAIAEIQAMLEKAAVSLYRAVASSNMRMETDRFSPSR